MKYKLHDFVEKYRKIEFFFAKVLQEKKIAITLHSQSGTMAEW